MRKIMYLYPIENMTAWTDLVKKVWDENRSKEGFKFKDALKLAKKQYKGKNKTVKKGGTCGGIDSTASIADASADKIGGEEETVETTESDATGGKPSCGMAGGKKSKRKTKKNVEMGGKKSKKGGSSNKIDTTPGGTPFFASK
jgi:hypothetical protein